MTRTDSPTPDPKLPAASAARLRPALDELYRGFDHVHSATDPVHIVRRFTAPDDREVVGFCAAGLAFGRVASVLQSIEALLAVMGPRPAEFVRAFEPSRERTRFEPLVHRWIRGRDLVALMLVMQRMLRGHGSIEAFFAAGDDSRAADVGDALESFSTRALDTDLSAVYGSRLPLRAGIGYFFPARRRAARASASTCSCGGWCGRTRSISGCGARRTPRVSSCLWTPTWCVWASASG